jgi:hypothetical protein
MQILDKARAMMEDALFLYVREHGDEPTDYDRDVFGLDEEGITHVLNFFDNGGCYFAMQNKVCCDIDLSSIESERDFYNLTCNEFTHYAFQCLYIVKDEEGTESLKYYAFENGGLVFDAELSEPDHDYVYKLSVRVMYEIFRAIEQVEI